MGQLIHRLASMKFGVALLVVILVGMAAGTIVEARSGAEAAARAVYGSLWFRLLLVLFAVNVACALADLWPWGWQRAGFLLTHGSMLVILIGACVTDLFKIEGRMPLWEGEESSQFAAGPGMAPQTLPFSVRLDAFEIEYYQGTHRPAQFRSRVTVTDPRDGRTFPAVIQMNQELSHAGFKLFQSSYTLGSGRDQTVLSVSRDPGQPIVFAGYALLLAGMVTVIATRAAQRRAAAEVAEKMARSIPVRRIAALSLAVAAAALGAPAARAAGLPDPSAVESLRHLPVQHDGRVMPLDTLAREAVWQVTGRYEWNGIDPVAMVLGWGLDPDGWAAEPLVPIDGTEMAAAIGLPAAAGRASFMQVVNSPRMLALIDEARDLAAKDLPLGARQRQAQKVEERLIWMQPFLQRRGLPAIPAADPKAEWTPAPGAASVPDLLALLKAAPSRALVDPSAMEREVTYNRVRPARVSWWILAVATALALAAWTSGRRWLDRLALAALVAGFAAMSWGLVMRWLVAGRIPASNMYESLLFLGWGVGFFAVIALLFIRNRLVVLNASAMSALTMLLVDWLPLDPFVHPMPPVLSGTPWLAIHVPIIMVSYSVLALGVLVAHMQIGTAIFAPSRRQITERMSDLLYWYTMVGSLLLIAGIISGSVWAASSWGRYWGWDPKEVWSLIAFLAYLAILHGRLDRLIGPFGVAALTIVAFWTILMTYVGVNFVLTAGLHSYGTGGTGVVRWMAIVGALEALFLAAGFAAQRAGVARAPA